MAQHHEEHPEYGAMGIFAGYGECDASAPVTDTARITVCDKCLQASCWQGVFMCWESRTAGTTVKTAAELRKLNLEHENYWR